MSQPNSNIEKYKLAFQEEARDLLVELEATLLQLNEDRTSIELVGQAFRALHTIKGSGAMFGFTVIAAFTHNIENAFDEVRNENLAVTADLVDLALAGLDHIKALLDEATGSDPADPAVGAAILAKLEKLTGTSAHFAAPVESTSSPAAAGITRTWRIHFAPGPDLLTNGTDPLLLLDELRQLGALDVTADTTAIPALADLDPHRCYIAWDLILATASPAEAIRDIFIFVEDACNLTIEPVVAAPALASAPPVEEPRTFGRRADDSTGSAANIRVPTLKLDQFVDLVGELVTVQARLAQIASHSEDPEIESISEEVERLTSALRENSMSIRMLPIRATFDRFRRLIHDLASDLHKEVELSIEGAETELDKTVLDQLNDPLMHLIRNSMDHGIEAPEQRLVAGKTAAATVHLSARYSGASVLITVSDDGRGIDTAAVRQRAIERGIITADAQLSDRDIFALIFEPGFSTAQQITDISGRGVGMDVVRRRIESLRGSIDIASTPNSGTAVTLRLPLTLAIIDGLLVTVGEASFVLPLSNILECIELTRHDIQSANGKHVVNVRGEIIPYIRLKDFFHIDTPQRDREQVLIVTTDHGRFGFVVDEVLGDHQTVIKNLGRFYKDVQVVLAPPSSAVEAWH